MPIMIRSIDLFRPASRMAFGIAAVLAASSSVPSAAQQPPPTQSINDSSMDRIREMVAKRRAAPPSRSPVVPPAPNKVMQDRASAAFTNRVRSQAMEERAKADLARAKTPQFIAAQEKAKKQIAQMLAVELGTVDDAVSGKPVKAGARWTPLVFVSSSMPIAVLRAYAAQLEPLGGAMLFRGAPGGLTRIAPFAKLTADILKRDSSCTGGNCAMFGTQVLIDPLAFRAHGIREVPAFSLGPGDAVTQYCEREDENAHGSHVVYGDAAISGLLEEYARLGGKEEVEYVTRRR